MDIPIAIVLAILANFQTGLGHLQQQEYEQAAYYLSLVVEDSRAANPNRDMARYYRAQANWAIGTDAAKTAAMHDMTMLAYRLDHGTIQSNAWNWVRRNDPWPRGLPNSPPYQVLTTIAKGVRDKNIEASMPHLSGDARQKVDSTQRNMFGELSIIAMVTGNGELVSQTLADDQQSAVIVVNNSGSDFVFTFKRDADKWTLDALDRQKAGLDNPAAVRDQNIGCLKQIGLALLMYSGNNGGKFPPNLQAVKDADIMSEGKVWYWLNPENPEEKIHFAYQPGLRDSDDLAFQKILAYSPKTSEGRREVLYIAGNAAIIGEAEFQRVAEAQGIDLTAKAE